MLILSTSGVTYFSFICALSCCIWTSNSVLSQDESSWTILQYEGLDELFVQTTRQFEIAPELSSADIRNVCDSVNAETYAASVRANNFRSSIRSLIANADGETASSGRENTEYRIYNLNEIRIHLYPCSETFFLTHAYEDEHLFFLFVYDVGTREMALEALVQEKAVALGEEGSEYDADDVEISYVGQRETFYEYLYKTLKVRIREDVRPENDPVCRASVEQKVRLCASVLNIPYYKSKYTFWPSVANVDKECRQTYLNLKNFDASTSEFMYRCYVSDTDNSAQRTAIYLSRGYRNYEVFASKIVTLADNEVDDNSAAAAAGDLVKLEVDVGKLFFITEPEYNEGMDSILMEEIAHYQSEVTAELEMIIEHQTV